MIPTGDANDVDQSGSLLGLQLVPGDVKCSQRFGPLSICGRIGWLMPSLLETGGVLDLEGAVERFFSKSVQSWATSQASVRLDDLQ